MSGTSSTTGAAPEPAPAGGTPGRAGNSGVQDRAVGSVIRSIAIAIAIAAAGTVILFTLNLAITAIVPDRYRIVVAEAAADGSLVRTVRLPLAPGKVVWAHDGNDCLILSMLVLPRESRVRASISPRIPTQPPPLSTAPGFSPQPHCAGLAALMAAPAALGSAPSAYYHRYLHGGRTFAAFVLAVIPFGAAQTLLLVLNYSALAGLALLAMHRRRIAGERRRATAVLMIAAVLALFYGLPAFGRSFVFAPTDLAVVGFLAAGLMHPLGRISERRYVIAVASFATAIAIFEFLSGGIPLAVATLFALLALGEAPDRPTLWRRVILGVVTFATAAVTCFAVKLLAVGLIWGSGEIGEFFAVLAVRMGGAVAQQAPPALTEALARFGIEPNAVDTSMVVRVGVTAIMLLYSAFVLGWGSHVVGVALVTLPLLALGFFAARALRRGGMDRAPAPEALLLLAGLVPPAWYLAFTNHTITHSYMMVRPMALTIALALIAGYWQLAPRTAALR